MQNLESAKYQSSNGYEAGGGEPNRQVHTLLLNQPKPPTMLPRRNDDDKGSISNFENQFSTTKDAPTQAYDLFSQFAL